mgnify:CR=1 FL=1
MKTNINIKTLIGLGMSLLFPVVYMLWIGPLFIKPVVDTLTYTLIGFAVLWLLALSVCLYVLFVEKRRLTSIGWEALTGKSILLAIGLGILLSLLVPIFTILASLIIKPSDGGSISQVASSFPWWVILLSVITAGVTEEVLFRAYPLSRLFEKTGNKWLSAIISLIFFVCIHSSGWNVAHIIGVVFPLGAILTGLFLWKRNLLFVIIVHIVIDLPLVFISLGS